MQALSPRQGYSPFYRGFEWLKRKDTEWIETRRISPTYQRMRKRNVSANAESNTTSAKKWSAFEYSPSPVIWRWNMASRMEFGMAGFTDGMNRTSCCPW